MFGALTRRGGSLPEGGDNNPQRMINGVGALSPRRVNAPVQTNSVGDPCVAFIASPGSRGYAGGDHPNVATLPHAVQLAFPVAA